MGLWKRAGRGFVKRRDETMFPRPTTLQFGDEAQLLGGALQPGTI